MAALLPTPLGYDTGVDSTVTGGEPGAAGDDRDWALLVSGAGMSKVFVLPESGRLVGSDRW